MTIEQTNSNVDAVSLMVFRGTLALILIIGVMINHKLFNNVRKEIHKDKGKVLQRIMKNYAIIQAIGWPCISLGFIALMVVLHTYGGHLNPCIYVYGAHILIFSYLLLRFYIGLNTLIIAFGRYLFVVHDDQVLKFGLKKVAKILIYSSFIIPLLMSLLAVSVTTYEYNGWLAEIHVHEMACSLTDVDKLKTNETSLSYQSPIYTLVHSSLPSSVTYCLYILYVVFASILYLNVTEGFIYVKCFVFVFR